MTQKISPSYQSSSFVQAGEPAACCTRARDFVVIGALASDRYTIRWSAIGDPTDFPTPGTDDARAKQAGQQSFPPRFGWVTGVHGNDFYMYVFQELAISKATYVGGDVVWNSTRSRKAGAAFVRACR